jgi:hypothetical protein
MKDLDFSELITRVPCDEHGNIIGTDVDGGVIGEKGEDGMKVWEEFVKRHPEAKEEFEDNTKKSEASDYIFCYWDY